MFFPRLRKFPLSKLKNSRYHIHFQVFIFDLLFLFFALAKIAVSSTPCQGIQFRFSNLNFLKMKICKNFNLSSFAENQQQWARSIESSRHKQWQKPKWKRLICSWPFIPLGKGQGLDYLKRFQSFPGWGTGLVAFAGGQTSV